LAVLAQLVETEGTAAVIDLVHSVFKTVQAMNPTKDANPYWQAVNRTMLDYGGPVADLWRVEKLATLESINISKEIGLAHYASEREGAEKANRHAQDRQSDSNDQRGFRQPSDGNFLVGQ
jgi:type II restriction enzyme